MRAYHDRVTGLRPQIERYPIISTMSSSVSTHFRLAESELFASALRAQVLERCRRTLNHDMNNAVQSMHSGLELLSKCINTAGMTRVSPQECIALLQQQFNSLQKTLNELIGEIAEAPGAPGPFDLSLVVREALHFLRHERAIHKAQSRIDADVHVHARKINVRTYVLALLLDAIDHIGADGTLEVTLTREGTRAMLAIKLASARLPAESESTSQIVHLVKRLLAAEEGELRSEAVANARIVTLQLPMPAEQTDSARQLTGSGDKQLRVLIADRNRDAAESLAMLVQLEGHEAKAAANAGQLNDLMGKVTPDVILLDADLPGLDVLQLTKTARDLPTKPILAQVSSSERDRRDGFDAFFIRPVEWPRLQKLLERKSRQT